jgi:translation initiation factor IF-3
MAENVGLDLVEVVATSVPPVCKIIDYGKFRYDQTKKEKENKKTQHQIKVKEVKLKPNIDPHDFDTKNRQARGFIEKGNKVKITCTFRGREMAHPEVGERWIKKMCEDLADIALIEATPKMMGKMLSAVLTPNPKKRPKPQTQPSQEKEEPSPLTE